MNAKELPPFILEYIFSLLGDNKSMCAFREVCRAWRDVASKPQAYYDTFVYVGRGGLQKAPEYIKQGARRLELGTFDMVFLFNHYLGQVTHWKVPYSEGFDEFIYKIAYLCYPVYAIRSLEVCYAYKRTYGSRMKLATLCSFFNHMPNLEFLDMTCAITTTNTYIDLPPKLQALRAQSNLFWLKSLLGSSVRKLTLIDAKDTNIDAEDLGKCLVCMKALEYLEVPYKLICYNALTKLLNDPNSRLAHIKIDDAKFQVNEPIQCKQKIDAAGLPMTLEITSYCPSELSTLVEFLSPRLQNIILTCAFIPENMEAVLKQLPALKVFKVIHFDNCFHCRQSLNLDGSPMLEYLHIETHTPNTVYDSDTLQCLLYKTLRSLHISIEMKNDTIYNIPEIYLDGMNNLRSLYLENVLWHYEGLLPNLLFMKTK